MEGVRNVLKVSELNKSVNERAPLLCTFKKNDKKTLTDKETRLIFNDRGDVDIFEVLPPTDNHYILL